MSDIVIEYKAGMFYIPEAILLTGVNQDVCVALRASYSLKSNNEKGNPE